MVTMSPQEVTRRLTVIAETRGVDLARYFENLEKAAASTGASIQTSERQFKAFERSVSPAAKALQELENAARKSFGAFTAGVADASRIESAFAAAVEKSNAALLASRSAADQAAEAHKRQREAYIEEGKAIRAAADAQEHYNRLIGVSSGGGIGGQAIANQMRERIAATEAEIKARAAAMEAAQQRATAAQAKFADPFRSSLSGKSAAESASVFKADIDAIESRTRALQEEGRAIRRAAEAQEAYNRLLGVSGSGTNGAAIAAQIQARIADSNARISLQNADAVARSRSANPAASTWLPSDVTGKSAQDSASVFEADANRARARFDPLFKAQRQYIESLREARAELDKGTISEKVYLDHALRARLEYKRVREEEIEGGRLRRSGAQPAARLALHQARNLGYQVNDVISGVMSGQSPAMIAAQQGGQIYQILSEGGGGAMAGAKRLASYLGEIVTIGRVATVGIAAFGFAAFKAFDDAVNRAIALQQALNGIGALSGQTVGGLQGIAGASAGAGRISIANAQSLAGGFANAGLQGGQIADLTGSTRNFAKAFGIDLDAAGKELAQAFRDPSKGAEELNRRFGTLNDATFEAIRRAQESGDANRAQALLLRAYNDAMSQVTVRTNALSDAFEKTKVVLSDLWTRFGQALSAPTAQERLEEAMNAPRRSRETLTRSQRLSLTRRGINPDTEYDRVEAGRQNNVIAAWRTAMEESAKAILNQRGAERSALSRVAGGYVREITPWEEAAKRFQDRIKAIGDALQSGALKGDDAARAREALERYGNSLRMTLPPMQQLQLQSALQIQQTLAMTAAQRAAVSAQQAYTQAISEGKTKAEATAAAEAAVNQARADGLRQALDFNRDARNRFELSSLLPGERGAVEIDQRIRDLRRQTEVGASADLPKVFVPFNLGLELATAALKDFTAAVTGAAGGPGKQAGLADSAYYAKVTNRVDQGTPFTLGPLGGLVPFASHTIRDNTLIDDLQRALDNRGRPAAPGLHAVAPTAVTRAGGMAVNPAAAVAANDNSRQLLVLSDQNEKYTRIVRQSAQDIELQNKALDSQIFNFGRSQSEVAAAAKMQELLNQAQRDGLTVTPAVGDAMAKVANQAGELAKRTAEFRESLQTLNDIRGGITDAFSSFATGMARGEGFAKSMQSAVSSLTNSLIRMSTNLLMKGLFGDSNFSGGLLSDFAKMLVPSANGNVFSGGNVVPFARGGVVSQPTIFPMAKGAGLMGEAGPEGILPLRRNNRGELGVMAGGAGGGGDSGLNVVVNNYAKSDVSVNESRGPDGRRMLEIMVEEKVAQTIANGGADSALRGRSGVMPRKVING